MEQFEIDLGRSWRKLVGIWNDFRLPFVVDAMARIATRTEAVTMMAVDYQVISSTTCPSFYSRQDLTTARTGSGSVECSPTHVLYSER